MIPKDKKIRPARYAMVVDLDRCNGCGAYMVSCAVENNVAPAAAKATERTGVTPMHVHRVQTENGAVFFPILCQQCDHETPCVSVCPQEAVELDPQTGIVGQIPARCLGCRYCMAACPYHARYFNWWDPAWPAGMERTLNPSVSPRMRGVVEKCNFCHGRWQAARQEAASKGENGPVNYTPACVEACPTRAIFFGDMNDKESAVAKAAAEPESFRLLESLHTGTKVYYRSRRAWVRNASGAMEDKHRG